MKIRTASAVLPVPFPEAFDFLSRIHNVPSWATEFVTGTFEVDGDRAIAGTAMGEVTMWIRADRPTGVVDSVVAMPDGREAVFPSRVVPLHGSRSLFLFTLIQDPQQPDEGFEAGFVSLQKELLGLATMLGDTGKHRAG